MYGWQSEMSAEVITLDSAPYEHARSFRDVWRLWRILDESSPDVLFIPGYREPLALAAALWGKIHGRTNVLMFDSTSLDSPRSLWKEKVKTGVTTWLFQKAFVSGKRSACYLRSLSKPPLPLEVGYDVVDNAHFSSRVADIHAARFIDRQTGPFLFVGRLVAAKNVYLLFDAFAAYRRQGGKRRLEIVGQGPLDGSLKAFAARADLANSVSFSGFQPYDSLPELYARAACLVLPSTSEPWGLVVNEAMAAGLPVIVSDLCGCVDDLVEHGSNGYVFPALSPKALTDYMFAIDARGGESIKAMGCRSREIIAQFSLETWCDAILRLTQERSACLAVA
jgi:glycosyltransferase involved in cell wall biosynthesis